MKIKKICSIWMAAALVVMSTTGCFGKPVRVALNLETEEKADKKEEVSIGEGDLKTGLSVVTSISSSKSAKTTEEGSAQTDVIFVGVLVDDQGVIADCVIDSVQAVVHFDENGAITTPTDQVFESKNTLGDAYGMKAASAIGREWKEQAEALSTFAVGKTMEELKGTAIDASGMALDTDLASSATIYLGAFVSAMEEAVNHAEYRGARAGDTLHLAADTDISGSISASKEALGQVQTSVTIAAVTEQDQTVTSCQMDGVQTVVAFEQNGIITSDLTEEIFSKYQLGDAYGMKAVSTIGMEWYEQADGFCEYVKGKTLDQILGIAVNETAVPTETDLSSSVTISIGAFQKLLEKTLR